MLPLAQPVESGQPMSRWPAARRFVRLLRKRPGALLAVAYLALVLLAAVAGGLLMPHDPAEQGLTNVLSGPSWRHPLGTDELGRDTLSRLIAACRIVVVSSLQATVLAAAIGVPIGAAIGYAGGWVDRVAMRILEAISALPAVVVLLTVIAVLGPGLTNAMVALGLAMSTLFIRVVRTEALAVREELFVDAARTMGLPAHQIIRRHIVPSLTPTVLVTLAMTAGTVLLAESGLSFLGIGVQEPDASWGSMLSTAGSFLGRQPLLAFPPGLAIAASVLSFNVIADTLRDASRGASPIPPTAARPRPHTVKVDDAPNSDGPIAVSTDHVLAVHGLSVALDTPHGFAIPVLTDVSLEVRRGEALGLVGESGSGKTIVGLAALGLLPPAMRSTSGTIWLAGADIATLSDGDLRRHRARHAGLVFQDPMHSLDPAMTVERQAGEALRMHQGFGRSAARARVLELLALVGITDPLRVARSYPHQLSGGMAQRVGIAAALACEPDLLVADEPTTALDVTVQDRVLDVLHRVRAELGTSIVFITHDLSLVADLCDRAAVVYAGQIVETGTVDGLFRSPSHPYTCALLAAHPTVGGSDRRFVTIPGSVPPPGLWPPGCRFSLRCPHHQAVCDTGPIELMSLAPRGDHRARCRLIDPMPAPTVPATISSFDIRVD
jgi:peptide/nickel transport system permease protein